MQAWAIFAMTELEAPAIESYRQRDANPEASTKAAACCADAAAVIEGALSGTHPHLGPSRFSVADIFAGGCWASLSASARSTFAADVAYMDSLAARRGVEAGVGEARLAWAV